MRVRLSWCGAIGLAACALVWSSDEDLNLSENETIRRSFAAVKSADVDDFDGSITVAGAERGDLEMEVHKTIRARSQDKIEEAKREVHLDIAQNGADLRVYVDGPFRCKCGDGSINYRGQRYYGYAVSFDVNLKVPRDVNLRLRTVNRGNIRVENTTGNFDVENINGGVDLVGVAGSGHAYALNRPLKVVFSRNPATASDFGSLNGDVDITFLRDFSADLWMKTFNGHAYTDFDVTALPGRPAVSERRDGKFVYKTNSFYGVRVGRGGPELKFDAFNGDIRIRQREQ